VFLGFQTTLFNDMRPFGVMTQVMVLFAACAGVIYGAQIGAVAGLIIGLMYDCVLTTPLGLASLAQLHSSQEHFHTSFVIQVGGTKQLPWQ
jgi:rod shape-determining protein MreD